MKTVPCLRKNAITDCIFNIVFNTQLKKYISQKVIGHRLTARFLIQKIFAAFFLLRHRSRSL